MASSQSDFFDFLGLFTQPPDWPYLPPARPIMAQVFFTCGHNRACGPYIRSSRLTVPAPSHQLRCPRGCVKSRFLC